MTLRAESLNARRRAIERRACAIVAPLALGLAISCAVAWVLALRGAVAAPPATRAFMPACAPRAAVGYASYIFDPWFSEEQRLLGVPGATAAPAQRWLAQFTYSRDSHSFHHLSATSTGWPAKCLCMFTMHETQRSTGAIIARRPFGGVLLNESSSKPQAPLFEIPLLPNWPGLAVNILFYAAIIAVPLSVVRRARTTIRRRRGRCLRCGYDLRHNFAAGCTECAWNRPQRPLSQPAHPSPPRHAPALQRLLRRLAVCLTLGGAINIALALTLGATNPRAIYDHGLSINGAFIVGDDRPPMHSWARRMIGRETVTMHDLPFHTNSADGLAQPPRWALRCWTDARSQVLAAPRHHNAPETISAEARAAGWPMKSLAGWHARKDDGADFGGRPWPPSYYSWRSSGLYFYSPPTDPLYFMSSSAEWSIPVGPLWPGIVLNTLFYATLLAIPLPLLRHTRAVVNRATKTTARRRIIALTALSIFCLALGVASNITVATACALASPTAARTATAELFELDHIATRDSDYFRLRRARGFGFDTFTFMTASQRTTGLTEPRSDPSTIPAFMLLLHARAGRPHIDGWAAGWPFRSLGAWEERRFLLNWLGLGPSPRPPSEGLYELKLLAAQRWALRPHALTIPLWPGFIANSALYAAAAALLILGARRLAPRATLRRHRGHCPRCACDLRATPSPEPCPECGWARIESPLTLHPAPAPARSADPEPATAPPPAHTTDPRSTR